MKRRIFERFDPRAIDGDNDGLVQDATPFERPSVARISGAIRRPEPDIFSSSTRRMRKPHRRSSGRVVDQDSDALYDEAYGPTKPSLPSATVGRSRFGDAKPLPIASDRLEIAREQRRRYYEQFRDPKTGKLKFPKPKPKTITKQERDKRIAKLLEDLHSGELSDLSAGEIAAEYQLSPKIVRPLIVSSGVKVRERKKYDRAAKHKRPNRKKINSQEIGQNTPKPQKRVSGSMSWGRFNPPKPQLRDISQDLELEDNSDDNSYSRSLEKPKTFNVTGISMRQWNEFSSDMTAYLQEALTDPKFEYGDSKTQSRERRRSLMRAIAAIKQANVQKNDDESLSMDFTEEGIRRLRTVLRVLKEQEVEGVRHIDALRDSLPNRKSGRSSKSAWPTRVIIDVKDSLGIPRVIRSGDPDVFDNQASAQKRSRELGCIGIRRYSTADGGIAWMPCTNESDYRRRRGIGPQAARDRKKREDELTRRIERRISRAVRAKDAQIGILDKVNRRSTVNQFHQLDAPLIDGKRFINVSIGSVNNNVQ